MSRGGDPVLETVSPPAQERVWGPQGPKCRLLLWQGHCPKVGGQGASPVPHPWLPVPGASVSPVAAEGMVRASGTLPTGPEPMKALEEVGDARGRRPSVFPSDHTRSPIGSRGPLDLWETGKDRNPAWPSAHSWPAPLKGDWRPRGEGTSQTSGDAGAWKPRV